ncbi:MAG: spore germination protein [Chloroflexi bacterium]|nr:spore germination protein [Chloroflexota bacterium]
MTKLIYALAFLCNGCIFLLVSLVFYSEISGLLTSADERVGWDTPSFWDLALVLRIVRVIFIVVGGLLTAFGVGAAVLWLKRPGRGDSGSPGSGAD